MPELPEVEHLRRSLLGPLVGARIARAALHRRDILRPSDHTSLEPLEGHVVRGLERRGKRLMVVTDGPALLVHLGMTGMLRVSEPKSEALPHLHAEAWLVRGGGRSGPSSVLRFHDARRFGSLLLYRSRQRAISSPHWEQLGPDALELTPDLLAQRLRGRRTAIKAALLDQGVVAGIGNIYADEALFRAQVHPQRATHRLDDGAVERLAVACRSTLEAAIAAGGSTIRDYVDACGLTGEFASQHAVYGRAGQPCLRCASTLRAGVVAGRTTVHCPGCQGRRTPGRR